MDLALITAVDGLTIGLAAHRITTLITTDKVWGANRAKLRNWLRRHGRPSSTVLDEEVGAHFKVYGARAFVAGKTVDALSCPKCMGVWVSVATYGVWHYGGSAPVRLAAIAGIQSLLVKHSP